MAKVLILNGSSAGFHYVDGVRIPSEGYAEFPDDPLKIQAGSSTVSWSSHIVSNSYTLPFTIAFDIQTGPSEIAAIMDQRSTSVNHFWIQISPESNLEKWVSISPKHIGAIGQIPDVNSGAIVWAGPLQETWDAHGYAKMPTILWPEVLRGDNLAGAENKFDAQNWSSFSFEAHLDALIKENFPDADENTKFKIRLGAAHFARSPNLSTNGDWALKDISITPKIISYTQEQFRSDNENVHYQIPRSETSYKWIRDSALRTSDALNADSYFINFRGLNGFESNDPFGEKVPHITQSELGSRTISFNGFTQGPMYDPGFELSEPPASGPSQYAPLVDADSFVPVDFLGLNTIIYEPNNGQLLGIANISGTNTLSTPAERVDINYINSVFNNSGTPPEDSLSFAIPTVLNSIILNRQGPHGWPSFKQIQGAQHPITRELNKNNSFSTTATYRDINSEGDTFEITSDDDLFVIRDSILGISQPVEVLEVKNSLFSVLYKDSFLNRNFTFSSAFARSVMGTSGTKSSPTSYGDYTYVNYSQRLFPLSKNVGTKESRSRQNSLFTNWRSSYPSRNQPSSLVKFAAGQKTFLTKLTENTLSSPMLSTTGLDSGFKYGGFLFSSMWLLDGLGASKGVTSSALNYWNGNISWVATVPMYRDEHDVSGLSTGDTRISDEVFAKSGSFLDLDFFGSAIQEVNHYDAGTPTGGQFHGSIQEDPQLVAGFLMGPRNSSFIKRRYITDINDFSTPEDTRNASLEDSLLHSKIRYSASIPIFKTIRDIIYGADKDTWQAIETGSEKQFNRLGDMGSELTYYKYFLDRSVDSNTGEVQTSATATAKKYYFANILAGNNQKWTAHMDHPIGGPNFNSYKEFMSDVRPLGKDYSVIPEFRIHTIMDEILTTGNTPKSVSLASDYLTIPSSLESSRLRGSQADSNILDSDYSIKDQPEYDSSPTSSRIQDLVIDSEQSLRQTKSFWRTYSTTELLKSFDLVEVEDIDPTVKTLKLSAKGIKKFLPYEGFYPAERASELVTHFASSYFGNFVHVDGEDAAHAYSPWLASLFAPGILFNSIKSGLAVDYPVYTEEYKLKEISPYVVNYKQIGISPSDYEYEVGPIAFASSFDLFNGWSNIVPPRSVIDDPDYAGKARQYDHYTGNVSPYKPRKGMAFMDPPISSVGSLDAPINLLKSHLLDHELHPRQTPANVDSPGIVYESLHQADADLYKMYNSQGYGGDTDHPNVFNETYGKLMACGNLLSPYYYKKYYTEGEPNNTDIEEYSGSFVSPVRYALDSSFNYRIPFEAIVDPDLIPPSMAIHDSGAWHQENYVRTSSVMKSSKNDRYKSASNNFFAECIDFFLEGSKLTSFSSLSDSDATFGNVKMPKRKYEYRMRLIVAKGREELSSIEGIHEMDYFDEVTRRTPKYHTGPTYQNFEGEEPRETFRSFLFQYFDQWDYRKGTTYQSIKEFHRLEDINILGLHANLESQLTLAHTQDDHWGVGANNVIISGFNQALDVYIPFKSNFEMGASLDWFNLDQRGGHSGRIAPRPVDSNFDGIPDSDSGFDLTLLYPLQLSDRSYAAQGGVLDHPGSGQPALSDDRNLEFLTRGPFHITKNNYFSYGGIEFVEFNEPSLNLEVFQGPRFNDFLIGPSGEDRDHDGLSRMWTQRDVPRSTYLETDQSFFISPVANMISFYDRAQFDSAPNAWVELQQETNNKQNAISLAAAPRDYLSSATSADASNVPSNVASGALSFGPNILSKALNMKGLKIKFSPTTEFYSPSSPAAQAGLIHPDGHDYKLLDYSTFIGPTIGNVLDTNDIYNTLYEYTPFNINLVYFFGKAGSKATGPSAAASYRQNSFVMYNNKTAFGPPCSSLEGWNTLHFPQFRQNLQTNSTPYNQAEKETFYTNHLGLREVKDRFAHAEEMFHESKSIVDFKYANLPQDSDLRDEHTVDGFFGDVIVPRAFDLRDDESIKYMAMLSNPFYVDRSRHSPRISITPVNYIGNYGSLPYHQIKNETFVFMQDDVKLSTTGIYNFARIFGSCLNLPVPADGLSLDVITMGGGNDEINRQFMARTIRYFFREYNPYDDRVFDTDPSHGMFYDMSYYRAKGIGSSGGFFGFSSQLFGDNKLGKDPLNVDANPANDADMIHIFPEDESKTVYRSHTLNLLHAQHTINSPQHNDELLYGDLEKYARGMGIDPQKYPWSYYGNAGANPANDWFWSPHRNKRPSPFMTGYDDDNDEARNISLFSLGVETSELRTSNSASTIGLRTLDPSKWPSYFSVTRGKTSLDRDSGPSAAAYPTNLRFLPNPFTRSGLQQAEFVSKLGPLYNANNSNFKMDDGTDALALNVSGVNTRLENLVDYDGHDWLNRRKAYIPRTSEELVSGYNTLYDDHHHLGFMEPLVSYDFRPFTPAYYEGYAYVEYIFRPTREGKHTLSEIIENTTVEHYRKRDLVKYANTMETEAYVPNYWHINNPGPLEATEEPLRHRCYLNTEKLKTKKIGASGPEYLNIFPKITNNNALIPKPYTRPELDNVGLISANFLTPVEVLKFLQGRNFRDENSANYFPSKTDYKSSSEVDMMVNWPNSLKVTGRSFVVPLSPVQNKISFPRMISYPTGTETSTPARSAELDTTDFVSGEVFYPHTGKEVKFVFDNSSLNCLNLSKAVLEGLPGPRGVVPGYNTNFSDWLEYEDVSQNVSFSERLSDVFVKDAVVLYTSTDPTRLHNDDASYGKTELPWEYLRSGITREQNFIMKVKDVDQKTNTVTFEREQGEWISSMEEFARANDSYKAKSEGQYVTYIHIPKYHGINRIMPTVDQPIGSETGLFGNLSFFVAFVRDDEQDIAARLPWEPQSELYSANLENIFDSRVQLQNWNKPLMVDLDTINSQRVLIADRVKRIFDGSYLNGATMDGVNLGNIPNDGDSLDAIFKRTRSAEIIVAPPNAVSVEHRTNEDLEIVVKVTSDIGFIQFWTAVQAGTKLIRVDSAADIANTTAPLPLSAIGRRFSHDAALLENWLGWRFSYENNLVDKRAAQLSPLGFIMIFHPQETADFGPYGYVPRHCGLNYPNSKGFLINESTWNRLNPRNGYTPAFIDKSNESIAARPYTTHRRDLATPSYDPAADFEAAKSGLLYDEVSFNPVVLQYSPPSPGIPKEMTFESSPVKNWMIAPNLTNPVYSDLFDYSSVKLSGTRVTLSDNEAVQDACPIATGIHKTLSPTAQGDTSYIFYRYDHRQRPQDYINHSDEMTLEASFNLFGSTNVENLEFDTEGNLSLIKKDISEGHRWVISPKFETPVLDFSHWLERKERHIVEVEIPPSIHGTIGHDLGRSFLTENPGTTEVNGEEVLNDGGTAYNIYFNIHGPAVGQGTLKVQTPGRNQRFVFLASPPQISEHIEPYSGAGFSMFDVFGNRHNFFYKTSKGEISSPPYASRAATETAIDVSQFDPNANDNSWRQAHVDAINNSEAPFSAENFPSANKIQIVSDVAGYARVPEPFFAPGVKPGTVNHITGAAESYWQLFANMTIYNGSFGNQHTHDTAYAPEAGAGGTGNFHGGNFGAWLMIDHFNMDFTRSPEDARPLIAQAMAQNLKDAFVHGTHDFSELGGANWLDFDEEYPDIDSLVTVSGNKITIVGPRATGGDYNKVKFKIANGHLPPGFTDGYGNSEIGFFNVKVAQEAGEYKYADRIEPESYKRRDIDIVPDPVVGMWHQEGRIPSKSNGLIMAIADTPSEVTAVPAEAVIRVNSAKSYNGVGIILTNFEGKTESFVHTESGLSTYDDGQETTESTEQDRIYAVDMTDDGTETAIGHARRLSNFINKFSQHFVSHFRGNIVVIRTIKTSGTANRSEVSITTGGLVADSGPSRSSDLEFYEVLRPFSGAGREMAEYGSLADLVGFRKKKVKSIGAVAEFKKVKEAVLAIPMTDSSRRSTISVEREHVQSVLAGNIEGIPPSIVKMVKAMSGYSLPPHMDFINDESIQPFLVYVLEFEHTFTKQDLTDIWQNLYPRDSAKVEVLTSEFEHNLSDFENFEITPETRWALFKVKQKAKKSYFNKVNQSIKDLSRRLRNTDIENLSLVEDESTYSYNWPYDYFSLVELFKMDANLELANGNIPSFKEYVAISSKLATDASKTPQELVDMVESAASQRSDDRRQAAAQVELARTAERKRRAHEKKMGQRRPRSIRTRVLRSPEGFPFIKTAGQNSRIIPLQVSSEGGYFYFARTNAEGLEVPASSQDQYSYKVGVIDASLNSEGRRRRDPEGY